MIRKLSPFALLLPLLLAGCLFDSKDDGAAPGPAALALTAGLYELSDTAFLTEAEDGVDATVFLHGKLLLRADSTYYQEGYVTSPALNLTNMRVYESRGKYRLRNDSMVLKTEITELLADFSEAQIATWGVPEEGAEDSLRVRHVTAASFETYGDKWNKWTLVSGGSEIVARPEPLYSHPELGLSLRIPLTAWTAALDTLIGTTRYEAYLRGPAVSGTRSTVAIYKLPRDPAKTLQAVMDETAQAYQSQLGATGLVKGIRVRGGAPVAEITSNWTSSGLPLRQKVLLVAKGDFLAAVYLTDLQANFDSNASLHAIDSSLTFF
jgi:hypothetical protein